jgi:hypothetical protein
MRPIAAVFPEKTAVMKINTAVISEEHRGSLGQDIGHLLR